MGDLRQVQAGLSFQYAPVWLESPQACALALPLPLRDESFGKPAATYFSNLLPEGPARQAVCARLGISYDNDYAQLQALGRDCAGAISVTDEAVPPKISGKRRRVTSVGLLGYLRSESVFAAAVGDDVRVLLAGAFVMIGKQRAKSCAACISRIFAKRWAFRKTTNTKPRAALPLRIVLPLFDQRALTPLPTPESSYVGSCSACLMGRRGHAPRHCSAFLVETCAGSL